MLKRGFSHWRIIVQIPTFPEAQHPIVKSLFHHSDRELLTLYQRYPQEGKYFTALFCRYSAIVYTLVHHSVTSPVRADYLFVLIWQRIFHEMRSLDLNPSADANEDETGEVTLQNWLIQLTALSIDQAQLPEVEAIQYSLDSAPPPLWCYLQQALDLLDPLLRLMVVMSQTFKWSETRIAAYLQAEGERLTPADVARQLPSGYRELETNLPEDIRAIYLETAESLAGSSNAHLSEQMS